MLTLTRYCQSKLMGTFGILRLESGWECRTIERPWLENTPFVSCVPEGTYDIQLDRYHAEDYPAYELLNVVGRTEIKIHAANVSNELAGCIAPGLDETFMKSRWAISSSKATLAQFMEMMGDRKRDVLKITHMYGG